MLHRYLFRGIIFLSVVSCAQAKNSIKHSYAFSSVRVPGNIAVDKNGDAINKIPDTVNVVYVETRGEIPIWKYAWKGNKLYAVNAIAIKKTPLEIGKNKINNQEIIITIADENKLWLLELLPGNDNVSPPQKINGGEILLQGSYKNKMFLYKITTQIELWTPDSV